MLLIALSGAWVLGIFLGIEFDLPPLMSIIVILPLIPALLFHRHRLTLLYLFFSLIVLLAAAVYSSAYHHYPDTTSVYNNNQDNRVSLTGIIIKQPEINNNLRYSEIEIQTLNAQESTGKILLVTSLYPEYRYGDVLFLKGYFEDPPVYTDFDYKAYLACDGIYSIIFKPEIKVLETEKGSSLQTWINDLRHRFSQILSASLPEPQAALSQGIVLGMKQTISDEIRINLSRTGTSHLLAISGINLSIIAGLLITLGIKLLGRRYYIYVWLSLGIIWFYSLMTGLEAPVIRSAIMASIFLLAEFLGRQKNVSAALALSAAIMIGIDPDILWSVSFQLSFLAMLGLVWITPLIQEGLRKAIQIRIDSKQPFLNLVAAVTDSLGVTLGAILFTWPVIAVNFKIVSLVGPFATLLIAPALPFTIITGIITALAGLINIQIAHILGYSAWIFLAYFLWMVRIFSELPIVSISLSEMRISYIGIYYAVIIISLGLKENIRKIKAFYPPISASFKVSASCLIEIVSGRAKRWIVPSLLLLAFLTAYPAATMPDEDLHVSFLDVGEGDAILIQYQNRDILIDGGPDSKSVCIGLSEKMPFWDRSLDMVILTHPHLDHLNGLIEVLDRYSINQVLAPNISSTQPEFQEWMNRIQTYHIKYTLAQSGQKVSLGEGVILEILFPLDTIQQPADTLTENQAVVSRLGFHNISFLFTADIDRETELTLISHRAPLSSTILKVCHHGSAGSNSAEFLAVVDPRIAVISVGKENLFGHPSEEVLERLKSIPVYRTDQNGAIEFTTDGEKVWIQTAENSK